MGVAQLVTWLSQEKIFIGCLQGQAIKPEERLLVPCTARNVKVSRLDGAATT